MNAISYPAPKRHLGQNFLIDQNISRKMVHCCQFKPEDIVLEIGPGLGALTRKIAPQVSKIIAVETDHNLVTRLQEDFKGMNVEIIRGDFLKFSIKPTRRKMKLIGNLPYNISTPIIEKILTSRHLFSEAYITVQWELGIRITAHPNTKEFGSLTCFVQYYTDPEILFKIKNSCFKPIPKIDSCFMRLRFKLREDTGAKNENFLFHVIRTAFQQRRKTILNALTKIADKPMLSETLNDLGISELKRAENLSLEDYVLISNKLIQTGRISQEERN